MVEITTLCERCPFCGANDAALSMPPTPWLVICGTCGAEGPYADKRKDAIAAWNTRDITDLDTVVRALEWIRAHSEKLRKGTDDWFELVEIEAFASRALSNIKREGVA